MEKTNRGIIKKYGEKMEAGLEVKAKKRRASVFDPFEDEVRKYIEMGINYSAIHKLISEKMSPKWGYNGFYRWVMRTIVA